MPCHNLEQGGLVLQAGHLSVFPFPVASPPVAGHHVFS